MARMNSMLNEREFTHRINRLRWEIKLKCRPWLKDVLSLAEIKRFKEVLKEWEKQFKKRFGHMPKHQTLQQVTKEIGIDH